MNIKLLEENENRLLNRNELFVEISGKNTIISRKELISRIASLKNVEEERVVIDKIEHRAGTTVANAFVKIYKSRDYAERIEPKYKLNRHIKDIKNEQEVKEGGKEKAE